jgi:ribokinase
MALRVWAEAGVRPVVTRVADSYTGAAFIFLDAATGDNAIIISPGAAATIAPADLEARAELIGGAAVFVTQLEQPL